jgi:hypothetical protein
VLRCGKYLDNVPPDLHAKAPFGIDSVFEVPTKRQQKLEFVFSKLANERNVKDDEQSDVDGIAR